MRISGRRFETKSLQPSFISVTYGAGGSTRAKTRGLTSRIKIELGIEAMAHLTCVGSDRAEIKKLLKIYSPVVWKIFFVSAEILQKENPHLKRRRAGLAMETNWSNMRTSSMSLCRCRLLP